jgi:hypothetical protein
MRGDQSTTGGESPLRVGRVERISSAFPAGWDAALDAAGRGLQAAVEIRALSHDDAALLRLRIGADRAWLDALRQADAA